MAGKKGRSGGPRPNSGGKREGAGRKKKEDRSLEGLVDKFDDPLEFLKTVMNDKTVDARIRVDAAKSLMPFIHVRKGEVGGKKEERAAAAKHAAGGRFAPSAPPRLVASGGKKI